MSWRLAPLLGQEPAASWFRIDRLMPIGCVDVPNANYPIDSYLERLSLTQLAFRH